MATGSVLGGDSGSGQAGAGLSYLLPQPVEGGAGLSSARRGVGPSAEGPGAHGEQGAKESLGRS